MLETTQKMNYFKTICKYRRAIMGFAALCVFFFHEWEPVFGDIAFIGATESFLKRICFFGVDVFLLLSGIGLTYSVEKNSMLSFYKKRLKRIIIPFVLVGIVQAFYDKWSIQYLINNLVGYNFYFVYIYSFLWFVPMIITLYLLFPIYYKVFSKFVNKALFTICMLGVWLLLTLVFKDSIRQDMYGFTNRIPIFLIGIYLGCITKKKEFKTNKATYIAWVFVLVLGLRWSYKTNFDGMYLLVPESNCCVPNILIACSLSILISGILDLLIEKIHTKKIGSFINKFLSFYGSMSLEFYCVQELLGRMVRDWLPLFGPRKTNLLLFVSTTIIAYCIYKFEKYIWERKQIIRFD